MNRFTISPEFFDAVAEDVTNDYLLNVLYVFAQDNKFKLCFDDKNLVFSIYESKIKDNQNLYSWLGLLNSRSHNIEKVPIEDSRYDDFRDLFLTIADAVLPEKKLITGDKGLYLEKQEYIRNHSIKLIDGDETKEMITKTSIQITYGDNSPIVNGSNNTLK